MARSARALGGAAEAWLDSLPATIEQLCAEWELRLGHTLAGGSAAFVAEVVTADGAPAVLKVAMPGDEPVETEIRALSLADGRGYARVLAADPVRRAMLVERLGAPLADASLPYDDQLASLAATLRAGWRPMPEPNGLLPLPEKAAWLIALITQTWADLSEPCSRAVIDRAVAYAEARAAAHDAATSVLLHGDPHAHNALGDPGAAGGYRWIDPDGVWGEAAYDVGALLRGGSAGLLAGDPIALGRVRCARMAALTGQPEDAIWAWGFVERVSTGLYAWKLGGEEEGRRMLDVAEAWTKGPA